MTDCKVLTIQDFSSFGQCSLSVALPIISAMGVETVALPIALLSTHTSNFEGYTYTNLQDNILPSINHYKTLGLDFEYIYLGYLGASSVAQIVSQVCDLFPNAKLVVDPAMAEGGELYDGISDDFVECVASICKKSLIALPNLSEACLLAGVPYNDIQTRESVLSICKKLVNSGINQFVITGIKMQDGMKLAHCNGNNTRFIDTQEINGNFFGCGDVFASTFVGALANNLDIPTCIDIALKYTHKSIEVTSKDSKHWYGLKFEKTLPYLIDLLKQAK